MKRSALPGRRILLGVTVDQSLMLMQDFPQELVSEGWEVHIVSNAGPALDALRTCSGVEVHAVPMRRGPSPLQDLASLVAWIRLLCRVRPDVVSVGTPKASLVGLTAAHLCRIPRRVYLLRGLRLEGERGLRLRLLAAMEKLTGALATDVLAVSHSLKKAVLDAKLVKSTKVHVLGAGSSNGVDLQRFRPHSLEGAERSEFTAAWGLRKDVPVVGFVGRLTYDKGVEHLLSASRLLHQWGCTHQLLIVGEVDDASSTSDIALTDATHEGIVITGRTADTRPFYQLMDVLALPTKREGLPNVVLEAQASGVPVITTDVTGARDSIVDEETGLLVRFGNESELARALVRILTDEDERRKMATAARRFASNNYAREVVWERLKMYYKARPDEVTSVVQKANLLDAKALQ